MPLSSTAKEKDLAQFYDHLAVTTTSPACPDQKKQIHREPKNQKKDICTMLVSQHRKTLTIEELSDF